MSDDTFKKDDDAEASFAELFEAYEGGMKESLRVGDRIRGKVLSIGRDAVFVDTGTKVDGVVEKAELMDDQGELQCKEGDVLDLFVVSTAGNEVKLSKALSGIGGLHLLKEAKDADMPVEGKVRALCKGGYNVEVMKRRAFCPASQMDLKYVEEPGEHVGKSYLFLVTQLEDKGKNIVVSRREHLRRELEKERKKFLEGLAAGAVLEGTVTKLMPFGAFIEIFPGIEGMVHLSELGWSRVGAVEEVLKRGDTATVKVLGIEQGHRPGQLKISLSIKQLTQDPWLTVEERFREGELVKGRVTRCADFGAFVEIAAGVEGLIHVSEMSYRRRVLKPEEIVRVGDEVHAVIKEIDAGSRRISLSLKEVEGDPWIYVPDKYQVGQTVAGILEKKENFGYFIVLEPGVTGLLPKSKVKESGSTVYEKAKPGDTVPVTLEEIKAPERKITLGPGDAGVEEDWRLFSKPSDKTLGSLGEKLQRAMTSKPKKRR